MAAKADTLPVPFLSTHEDNYHKDVMASILQFLKQSTFTDFKIKVRGKNIECHKILLSATCPYFAALFSSNMKESQQGEITLDTLEYDVLKKIIEHLYGSNITVEQKIQDLVTLVWQEGPKMLEKMQWPIAAAMDEKIYVVNNENSNAKRPVPLQLLQNNVWQYKCSLPKDVAKTNCAILIALAEKLYLFGGYNRINACYSPVMNTWTLLNRPSNVHWGQSALVYEGKIYLCGGGTDCIEEYDITKDEWAVSSRKLPRSLNFFTAAFVSFL